MANLIMRPSKGSSQRRIIVWMFTKSQLGGRCGYWVWSPSGNCWENIEDGLQGELQTSILIMRPLHPRWIGSVEWLKNNANCTKESRIEERSERSELTNVTIHSQ